MDEKLCIRVLNGGDESKVRRMIEIYFQEDEVSKCLNLSAKEKSICADAYVKHVVPYGLSVGIFDEVAGDLLGCVLATDRYNHVRPEDYNNLDECPNLQKLARFDSIMEEYLQSKFPNDNYAFAEMVIVHPKVMQKGLARRIMDWLTEFVARKGYSVIFSVALPNEMRAGVQRRGWVLDYSKEIKYADYRDPVTGEAVFERIPAHYTGAVPLFKILLTPNL